VQGDLEREAIDLASDWAERYGAVARLKAALEARMAMEKYDLPACAFWRMVLDRLDDQLRQVPWTH
jgi:hypothetical protein